MRMVLISVSGAALLISRTLCHRILLIFLLPYKLNIKVKMHEYYILLNWLPNQELFSSGILVVAAIDSKGFGECFKLHS